MAETDLRKPFIKMLREAGSEVTCFVGSTMQKAGLADVFVADTRWHGWIEFKGPRTKQKPAQEKFIFNQRIRNVEAYVLRFKEIFDDGSGSGTLSWPTLKLGRGVRSSLTHGGLTCYAWESRWIEWVDADYFFLEMMK